MKNNIRKEFITRRKSLDSNYILSNSDKIYNNMLKLSEGFNISKYCSYISINNEVDTKKLNDYLLSRYELYLPRVIDKNNIEFLQVDNDTSFEKSRFGIYEPVYNISKKLDSKNNLAIILPLIAFDDDFTRIGYGCGYYDRYFRSYISYQSRQKDNIVFIGLAYSIQRAYGSYRTNNDITCDIIVTEEKIIYRNKEKYVQK